MKKYSLIFTFVCIVSTIPLYPAHAQYSQTIASCTALDQKKSSYETLKQQYIPEAIEQQTLFAQFQRLRTELESFRNQKIAAETLSSKSIEIEALKQSIQLNEKVLESKIQSLDASISAQFFQEAKSIITLTLQCTQSKVSIFHEKFSSLYQNTQDESKKILIQEEISKLNSLRTNLQASIDYIEQIIDRKELKSEQKEIYIFLNTVKSSMEYTRKVYNFVTFETHLKQLQNIVHQVQKSSIITDSNIQENIINQIQNLETSTRDLSSIENTNQKIEFLSDKKSELREILEQLKIEIQNTSMKN